MNFDIKAEQLKAQETIKNQGLRVLVCAGTGCVANGSLDVIARFEELGVNVGKLTTEDKLTIIPTGCHGFCEQGVLVCIPQLHTTYVKVKVEANDEDPWDEIGEDDVEEINNVNAITDDIKENIDENFIKDDSI